MSEVVNGCFFCHLFSYLLELKSTLGSKVFLELLGDSHWAIESSSLSGIEAQVVIGYGGHSKSLKRGQAGWKLLIKD